ncbi:MAG: hypothetical protein QE277_10120 [Flectobacillus sp.]|nr:hypothetical protein [Flectobacillus sp.]
MGRVVEVNKISSVFSEVHNHEKLTQFTLGLYLDMLSASGNVLQQQLSRLTLKYNDLTIYYCTSIDKYIYSEKHKLPYYELYQLNEKIAERTATGRLYINELKDFLETHLSH